MYTNYNKVIARRCKYTEDRGFVDWTTNINGDIIDWVDDTCEIHYIYDEKGEMIYEYIEDAKGKFYERKVRPEGVTHIYN